MKTMIWVLVWSVVAWPMQSTLLSSSAHATNTSTTASIDTQTASNTSTATNANCHAAGEGGGGFSHCTTADNQENSQSDTQELNEGGGMQSTMLGMAAIASGGAMVAAGMACSPHPCSGLISAGSALIAAGTAGLMAASMMAGSAGMAGYNDYNMGRINDPVRPGIGGTPITQVGNTGGTDIGGGNTNNLGGTQLGDNSPHGPASGIKLDDSFTRTGKSGAIFDEFENKTGIGRDALVNGLKSGQSAADILANSDKMKGASAADIQKMIDGASGSPMSASDAMAKLGLTPEELAAMAKANGGMGDGTGLALGAGGGARGPASVGAGSLDGLFGGGAGGAASDGILGANTAGISADIQAAFDRNGITNLSIFQMVHHRYKTKTPMMFGEAARKPSAASENPFANMVSGKVEF